MVHYAHDDESLNLLLELLIDIFLELGGTDDETDEHSLSKMQQFNAGHSTSGI